jgi:oxygen-independent coproporphyrinogen-3 oxidase
MNSLRLTDGVAQTLFQQRSGQDFAKIAPQIKSLQQRGLLRSGDRIATTALGRRYLDSILEQFI